MIPQAMLDFNDRIVHGQEAMDKIDTVIEKPIMLFRMNEGSVCLYYLRAIGWNKTMLLSVQKNNGGFEVVCCELDPPIERINELHLKGERLI